MTAPAKPKRQQGQRKRRSVPCVHCGHRVSDVKRTTATDFGTVERVRKCAACQKRFTSRETTGADTGSTDLVTAIENLRRLLERRK